MTRSVISIATAFFLLLSASAAMAGYTVVAPGQRPPAPPPPQPPTPPKVEPQPQVVVPDSRGWTIKQAMAKIGSKDKGTRLAALYRVGREPGAKYQKVVAKVAQTDKEARIRYEAVRGLAFRNEPASLPVLLHISETDRDPRVRAMAAQAYSRLGMPAAPAEPAMPPKPAATTPAPASPAPSMVIEEAVEETPPGMLDATGGEEVPWGVEKDEESVGASDEKKESLRAHGGFLPALGFDGAMGSPRDTKSRSDLGIQVGFGYGRYEHAAELRETQINGGDWFWSKNRFTSTDLAVTILGHWSPGKYFEVGASLEVFTYERLEHERAWWRSEDGSYDDGQLQPGDEDVNWDVVDQDSGYSGGAFGLLSLDLKSVFVQTNPFRLGVALRTTFPTHSGARFDEGLGASDMFLPGSALRTRHRTDAGRVFGLEPGIVMSIAPSERFTIYADVTLTMAFLSYTEVSTIDDTKGESEGSATNMTLFPHLGAQVRFLGGALGVQLAVSPAIYLGTSGDMHFSGLAVVPGIEAVFAKHLHLSLTADVDFLGSAPQPFECTNAVSDSNQSTSPASCGLGRRVGAALQTSWEF